MYLNQIDSEHMTAAATWVALDIDVLFYQKQGGKFDVGDIIKRVSDLGLQHSGQVDVLLEDHCSFMPQLFAQPHFLDVLRNVYHDNKLFRFGILTCWGRGVLHQLRQEALSCDGTGPRAPCGENLPIFDNLNGSSAGPNFQTLIFPTGDSIRVGDGLRGKGVYQRQGYSYRRSRDIEKQLNDFSRTCGNGYENSVTTMW